MRTGRIHYAKLGTSERLQRAHAMLSDGGWHSARSLCRAARCLNPNTLVSELRANGLRVLQSYRVMTADCRKISFYRLVAP